MPQKFRTLLLALGVIFVVAMLTVVFLFVGRTPPPSPLPNPNGYDDFLKAAASLTGDVGNASTLDHDGLRALVSTNADSLRLLRLGLTRGCSVPTDSQACYGPAFANNRAGFAILKILWMKSLRAAGSV